MWKKEKLSEKKMVEKGPILQWKLNIGTYTSQPMKKLKQLLRKKIMRTKKVGFSFDSMKKNDNKRF